MRLRDEELAQEVEHLKHQLEELERLARGRGLPGVFNFRHANAEDGKSGKQAWLDHKIVTANNDYSFGDAIIHQ